MSRACRANEKSHIRGIALGPPAADHSAVPSIFRLRRPRRARQRVRDDQDLLDALLKIVGVPVVACAADGTLTYANRPTCELLRMDCAPALGSPPESWIRELYPRTPSGIPLLREDLPPVRALEGEVVRGVEVLVSIQGSDVLLNTQASPVTDEKGRRRGAVVVLEDVTERRRRERRLRNALRALDTDQNGCR
jgi:PAS domain S-box-containing protein